MNGCLTAALSSWQLAGMGGTDMIIESKEVTYR